MNTIIYMPIGCALGRVFVKGTMGAHLQKVHTKYVARSRKNTKSEEYTSSSQMDQTFDSGQSVVIKRRTRAMHRPSQEKRIARVEELRTQVRAGTYKVDSMALAQRILLNESHFVETLPR